MKATQLSRSRRQSHVATNNISLFVSVMSTIIPKRPVIKHLVEKDHELFFFKAALKAIEK